MRPCADGARSLEEQGDQELVGSGKQDAQEATAVVVQAGDLESVLVVQGEKRQHCRLMRSCYASGSCKHGTKGRSCSRG